MNRIGRLGSPVESNPAVAMTDGTKPPKMKVLRAGDDCPHCRRGILRLLNRDEKRRYKRIQKLKVVPEAILYCDSCSKANR